MSLQQRKIVRKQLKSRWHGMKSRCNNPKSTSYQNYGGRGIKVCEEWEEFENFFNWSTNSGFSPELQIDRIDNDGGYSPDNCRWVTAKVNVNNQRPKQPRSESAVAKRELLNELNKISQETGISLRTLRSRYNRGQRGSELTEPLRKPWDRARELRKVD